MLYVLSPCYLIGTVLGGLHGFSYLMLTTALCGWILCPHLIDWSTEKYIYKIIQHAGVEVRIQTQPEAAWLQNSTFVITAELYICDYCAREIYLIAYKRKIIKMPLWLSLNFRPPVLFLKGSQY